MAVLNVEVVNAGIALMEAAEAGREASVKFLLQQEGWTTVDDGAHLKVRASRRRTAFLHACGISGESSPSPRIARLLMEAGADRTSIVRLLHDDGGGKVVFNDTTPAYAAGMPRGEEKTREGEATEEEGPHRLEAIRWLLLQEAGVHAVSWLWGGDYPRRLRCRRGRKQDQNEFEAGHDDASGHEAEGSETHGALLVCFGLRCCVVNTKNVETLNS